MIKSKQDLYPSTVAYIKRTANKYSDASNTYDWLVYRVSNEFAVPKSTAREWIYLVTNIVDPSKIILKQPVMIKENRSTPGGSSDTTLTSHRECKRNICEWLLGKTSYFKTLIINQLRGTK